MGFILFHGNDFKLIRREVRLYEEGLKKEFPDIEQDTPENPTLAQIQNKISSGSLFAEKQILKIFEPEKISGFEKILDLNPDAFVILVSDKETNPFKKVKGLEVRSLNLPRNYEIEKLLFRRFARRMAPEAVEYLSRNLSSLVDLDELEEEMKAQGIEFLGLEELYRLKGDTEARVFLIVDAILQKKVSAAIVEINEFLQAGGYEGLLLNQLSNQFQKILMARRLLDSKKTEQEIIEILGGHPFAAKKFLQTVRTFSQVKIESLILSLTRTGFQMRYYDKTFIPYFIEKLILETAG